MRNKYLLIAILTLNVCFHNVYAQHSESFLKLVNKIKPSDTLSYQYNYKNGSIKEKGTFIEYKTPIYTYYKKSGKIFQYHRNGLVKSIEVYDSYENSLSKVFYNDNGTLWWKIETIEINSNLESSENYFTEEGHIIITMINWSYKYGKDIGKMYLREKGNVKNGKKIGLWMIYNQRGKLEEEIDYY